MWPFKMLAATILGVSFCLVPRIADASSQGVDDVIALQRAGISHEVMLAWVESSSIPYTLSSEDITALQDGGVSATIIVAMIDRGKALKGLTSDAAPADTAQSAPSPVAEASPVSPYAYPTPSSGATTVASPNQVVSVAESTPTVVQELPPTTVMYAPPAGEVSISYFYESLSPYGTWSRHDPYGWVWYPRVVYHRPEWRPYCDDGRWVWTDCGWYWESNYPWGWAAFHYGRWVPLNGRWAWCPGTEWGPAWVTWRSSASHCGWAPLPPEVGFDFRLGFSYHNRNVGFALDFAFGDASWFTFVPVGSFLAPNCRTAAVPTHRVTNIYNETTIINNSYTYNTTNNTVINSGIPMQTVATRTGRQIERLTVTDMVTTDGAPILAGERRSRSQIQALRPAISRTATTVDPPTAMRRRDERIRTWAASNASTVRGKGATPTAPLAQPSGQGKTQLAPDASAAGAPNAAEESAARERLQREQKRMELEKGKGRGDAVQQAPSPPSQKPSKARAEELRPSAPATDGSSAAKEAAARERLQRERERMELEKGKGRGDAVQQAPSPPSQKSSKARAEELRPSAPATDGSSAAKEAAARERLQRERERMELEKGKGRGDAVQQAPSPPPEARVRTESNAPTVAPPASRAPKTQDNGTKEGGRSREKFSPALPTEEVEASPGVDRGRGKGRGR